MQLGFCSSCTLYLQRLPASSTVTLTDPEAPLKMPVPPTMALAKVAFCAWAVTIAKLFCAACTHHKGSDTDAPAVMFSAVSVVASLV